MTPPLFVPKRVGGLRLTGAHLRSTVTGRVDAVWINDPALGVHCVPPGIPAVYDVTDDWRAFNFPKRVLSRLIRAEDRLVRIATTVVCSAELQARWRARYGVEAPIVNNGLDLEAWNAAPVRALDGPGPHGAYVGTLHDERLDVALLVKAADVLGTLHLIGPDALSDASRRLVSDHPRIRIHGAIPAEAVPSWSKSMDVLLCPHLVTAFTLSLDAIKSYEYLSSGRPVVATATSGFQLLAAANLRVVSADAFVANVRAVLKDSPASVAPPSGAWSWASRTQEFARVLQAAVASQPPPGRRYRRARGEH